MLLKQLTIMKKNCVSRGEGYMKNLNTPFCKILHSCDDQTKISSET